MPNGTSFKIRTPDNLSANTKGLEPAYGTIRMQSDQAVDGALVYLTLDGGQELSTLTKPSGLWLIPLNQVRSADLTSFCQHLNGWAKRSPCITIILKHQQLPIRSTILRFLK